MLLALQEHFILLETVTSCIPRAKSFSSFFNGCSKGSSWVFHGYFKFMGILGAKAPLGPKDVKVKMKAKS